LPEQTRVKRHTILHFCNNLTILTVRGWIMKEMGYCVLNSATADEAIALARQKCVDVVVIDLDKNSPEAVLVAKEARLSQPDVAILVLAEANEPVAEIHHLADRMISRLAKIEGAMKIIQNLVRHSCERSASGPDGVIQ